MYMYNAFMQSLNANFKIFLENQVNYSNQIFNSDFLDKNNNIVFKKNNVFVTTQQVGVLIGDDDSTTTAHLQYTTGYPKVEHP